MISNMRTLFGLTLLLSSVSAGAVLPRGRAVPDFYLVSVAGGSSSYLTPLSEGPNGSAQLVGGTSVSPFYLDGGHLIIEGGHTAYINFLPTAPSGCSTSGKLMFGSIAPSNACAKAVGFGLQSDSQNSQLGAKLSFNPDLKFSACSDGSVYVGEDAPVGCTMIDFWTVPTI